MDLTLGQVVYSKAGRDKGKKFIVVDIVDELYVMISDGDLRRIENAKRKKLKHLSHHCKGFSFHSTDATNK